MNYARFFFLTCGFFFFHTQLCPFGGLLIAVFRHDGYLLVKDKTACWAFEALMLVRLFKTKNCSFIRGVWSLKATTQHQPSIRRPFLLKYARMSVVSYDP